MQTKHGNNAFKLFKKIKDNKINCIIDIFWILPTKNGHKITSKTEVTHNRKSLFFVYPQI